MKLYPAIIVKDYTDMPQNYSKDDYIRVRIPAFHGPSSKLAYENSNISTETVNIAYNIELPWAVLNRSFENKNFSATQFESGDIVTVILENNDIAKPVIMGYGSRFSYTEDPDVAENNRLFGSNDTSSYGGNYGDGNYGYSDFSSANDVVKIALQEAAWAEQAFPNHDMGNINKYTKAAGVPYESTQWCGIFCWWVFKQANASQYFLDGGPVQRCVNIKKFYQQKNQFITNGFKAGDLIFMNWHQGVAWPEPQHIGIAVSDQNGDSVETVEGNTRPSGVTGGKTTVMRKTRKIGNSSSNSGFICGGVRLGLPIASAPTGGDNETIAYKYLNGVLGANNAICCAIMANIYHECAFKTNIFDHDYIDTDGLPHIGICMWGSGRRKKLIEMFPNSYTTLNAQLQYLGYELKGGWSYKGTSDGYRPKWPTWGELNAMPNTSETAYNVAVLFAKSFEICSTLKKTENGVTTTEFQRRGNDAVNKYWPKYCEMSALALGSGGIPQNAGTV